MALTPEQIEEYEKLSQGQRSSGIERYLRLKLPDGTRTFEATVRIIAGSELVVTGQTHYLKGPKSNSGTCPGHFGEDGLVWDSKGKVKRAHCPACSFFFLNIQDFKKTEMWDNLKTLGPKHRMYFNVYDPESNKILIWSLPSDGPDSFGNAVLGGIVDYAKKNVDVTDPKKGRNLAVTLTRRGAAFLYSGIWATKGTPLPKKLGDNWKEDLHDLAAIPNERVLTQEDLKDSVEWFKEKAGIDG